MQTDRDRPNDLLTSGDVARIAGVSAETVRQWSDLARLPTTRTVGGVRLFRRDDVEAYLATRPKKDGAA